LALFWPLPYPSCGSRHLPILGWRYSRLSGSRLFFRLFFMYDLLSGSSHALIRSCAVSSDLSMPFSSYTVSNIPSDRLLQTVIVLLSTLPDLSMPFSHYLVSSISLRQVDSFFF
jgi:hypothetical protein